MLKNSFLAILFLIAPLTKAQVSHDIWDGLLKKYVSVDGIVNYKSLLNQRALLKQYLAQISAQHPSDEWGRDEKLTYWINTYNAFTIELILNNYPVKSIKDINKPWDQRIIAIQGKKYSLNDIEHKILRKEFNEPKIHFAIVCASVSCPQLRNEAYNPERLLAQLRDQARKFVNDPTRNNITSSSVQISKIFDWFKDDFTVDRNLIQFLNIYSKVKIPPSTKIAYLEYNWGLNE